MTMTTTDMCNFQVLGYEEWICIKPVGHDGPHRTAAAEEHVQSHWLQPPEPDAGLRDERNVSGTEWCPTCGHKILVDGDDPLTCSYCVQSDTGQPGREWTASEFDGNLDGYPLLSPEGLAAIATDPEYQARILVSVNSHASLIAALERTQKFLLLLTDAGVLDQVAAEYSHPDEVNGLCDAVDEALKHAREGG